MGHYTEFHFNVELKKDTPDNVLYILYYMLDQKNKYYKKPDFSDHPFFQCDRWTSLFIGKSEMFPLRMKSILYYSQRHNHYLLNVSINLKNYDNEIKKFLDWISSYVYPTDYMLGYYRNEDQNRPTVIYLFNPNQEIICNVHSIGSIK